MDSFEVSAEFEATPRDLYAAWLNADSHTAFTQGQAESDPVVGGAFSAWDGYITGRYLALQSGVEIVQAWRTSDFAAEDADSQLVLQFANAARGAKVTILHSNLPDGQGDRFRQGWQDFYFDPLRMWLASG